MERDALPVPAAASSMIGSFDIGFLHRGHVT
jgi:hypothetical protein